LRKLQQIPIVAALPEPERKVIWDLSETSQFSEALLACGRDVVFAFDLTFSDLIFISCRNTCLSIVIFK
jgi:hypothetical protein